MAHDEQLVDTLGSINLEGELDDVSVAGEGVAEGGHPPVGGQPLAGRGKLERLGQAQTAVGCVVVVSDAHRAGHGGRGRGAAAPAGVAAAGVAAAAGRRRAAVQDEERRAALQARCALAVEPHGPRMEPRHRRGGGIGRGGCELRRQPQ